MARYGKIIKGTHYQVGRFVGKWYVVDLDHMKFIYGPFSERTTAHARLKKMETRMNPRRRLTGFPVTKRKRKGKGKLPTPRTSRYSRFRVNARKTLIYGKVLKIYAQKTTGPHRGQRFVHTFKAGAVMWGMPDGSLRIEHP